MPHDQHGFVAGTAPGYCGADVGDGAACNLHESDGVHRLVDLAQVPNLQVGDGSRVLRAVGDGSGWRVDPALRSGAAAGAAPVSPPTVTRRLWRVRVTDPLGRVVYTPPVAFEGPLPSFAVAAEHGWAIELEVTEEAIQRWPWQAAYEM